MQPAGDESLVSREVTSSLDEKKSEQMTASAEKPAAPVAPASRSTLVGLWKFAREVCDPEMEMEPRQHIPNALLHLKENGQYQLSVEGFLLFDSYTVSDHSSGLSVDLNNSPHGFRFVDGHLENWNEGDAVYGCGRVFERVGD